MSLTQALGPAPMRDSSPAPCSSVRALPPSDSAGPLPHDGAATSSWKPEFDCRTRGKVADPATPSDSPTASPTVLVCAPEGMAYRGLFFGLLLALPFWLMVIALVVVLL